MGNPERSLVAEVICMYCGIDVSKNKSQVCLLSGSGKVVEEFQVTHDKQGFDELLDKLEAGAKIGMETTGNYSTALYLFLKRKGHDVHYVDNHQMHNFAKLHYLHIKNDRIDAKLIARYLIHDLKKIVPVDTDSLKDLNRLYYKTQKQLARYKLMFKDQASVIFPELEKHYHISNSRGIWNLLIQYPSPRLITNASAKDVMQALNAKLLTEKYTIDHAEKLIQLSHDSVGADVPSSCFKYTVMIMEFYDKLVRIIKKMMVDQVKKSRYWKLSSEFGYKDTSLSVIIGEVGDITRFPSCKKFVSYCGFDITEKQSGTIAKRSYITKKGNSILRHTFYILVLTHLRYNRNCEIAQFYHRLKAKGKHAKKCQVAAARKLAVRTYYLMLNCH